MDLYKSTLVPEKGYNNTERHNKVMMYESCMKYCRWRACVGNSLFTKLSEFLAPHPPNMALW